MVAMTPIEEAIADKVDRRRRYNKRLQSAGLVRRSYWLPLTESELIHGLVEQLSSEHKARAERSVSAGDDAGSLASKLREFFDEARTSTSSPTT